MIVFKNIFLTLFIFGNVHGLFAQTITLDSLEKEKKRTLINGEMHYSLGNGKTLVYSKPKLFGFITNLPKDAANIGSAIFKKQSVKPLIGIAASTTLLMFFDQDITDGFVDFAHKAGVDGSEKNVNLLKFKLGEKEVALFRLPANLNTAFYQLGQGFPSLAIGAGLYAYGKIHHDYRASSTASQLAESFILMGFGTQLVKRITGRQSPSDATDRGGNWHFFPSFSEFQNNTPLYDAFPSGHMATLMSSVTIFAENYPEKRWIKPVGYSLSGLVCLSMINNKVHWASDYPLAIGMGYLCAKQVVRRNRRVLTKTGIAKKKQGEFDYTINYINGTIAPGFIYKF